MQICTPVPIIGDIVNEKDVAFYTTDEARRRAFSDRSWLKIRAESLFAFPGQRHFALYADETLNFDRDITEEGPDYIGWYDAAVTEEAGRRYLRITGLNQSGVAVRGFDYEILPGMSLRDIAFGEAREKACADPEELYLSKQYAAGVLRTLGVIAAVSQPMAFAEGNEFGPTDEYQNVLPGVTEPMREDNAAQRRKAVDNAKVFYIRIGGV